MYGCLPLSPLYLTLDNKGLTESGAHCLVRSIFLTLPVSPGISGATNMAFHTGAEPTHGTVCSHSGSILTWPFTLVLGTHTLHRMLA